jgi:hypothetical protein
MGLFPATPRMMMELEELRTLVIEVQKRQTEPDAVDEGGVHYPVRRRGEKCKERGRKEGYYDRY